ncbi:helix-hairpin-helix domain-containing protein [Thiolapillus sp.]
MKKSIPADPAAASQLEDLPNIGPAMVADLRLIGIEHPAQLAGKDAFALYDKLCAISGKRHDPCVIDVFLSAIHYMDTGAARPWWKFTPMRKQRQTD